MPEASGSPSLRTMRAIRGPIAVAAGLFWLGAAHAEESTLARGRRLVEINCARCHAVAETGLSPFAPAPPFREVARNYTQDEMVDGFMEGLAVRHPAMPDWDMTMDQAEAVATYIMALEFGGGPAEGDAAAVAGYRLLQKNCARCHAIGEADDSPLAAAPPFRDVVGKYRPAALAEGIVTGHAAMPVFAFKPDEVAAIVAYLESLAGE
jgi:mono/diheme cytochrome c family protein